MRSQTQDREVVTKGGLRKGNFQISFDDQEFLMRILRDTMYRDKVLAVLREYSANAWDAHVDAGIPDIPIKITLPTALEPTLKIRDFGLGLSEEDVFGLYPMYGKSTKRDSDTKVGLYGIGCKSGFAYGDSFTVTSWHGGHKKIYVASLDQDDMGDMTLLHSSECSPEETGIEISIAVRTADVDRFHQRAQNLFPFYFPFPDINDDTIQPVAVERLREHGYLGGVGTWGWVAIMGCIPYRIDMEQIEDLLAEADLETFTKGHKGGLFFDISEVKINASREDLEYKEQTRQALVNRFKDLRSDVAGDLEKDLNGDSYTTFQKRLKVQEAKRWGIAPPEGFAEFLTPTIKVSPSFGKWRMVAKTYGGSWKPLEEIQINGNTSILIKDQPNSYNGYSGLYSNCSIIVTTLENEHFIEEPENLRAELEEFLAEHRLDGLPIQNISKLEWYPPRVRSGGGGQSLRKHRVNCFELDIGGGEQSYRMSDYWKIVDRDPTDEDVFVVLRRFEAVGFGDFYDAYKKDKELLSLLGEEIPPIYGYKTTQKKPVEASECQGIEYQEWRKGLAQRVLDTRPDIATAIPAMHWSCVFNGISTWRWESFGGWDAISTYLLETFPDHPLGVIFRKRRWGRSVWKKAETEIGVNSAQMEFLFRQTNPEGTLPEPSQHLDALFARYPLLDPHKGCRGWDIWQPRTRDHWRKYVEMVDQMEASSNE